MVGHVAKRFGEFWSRKNVRCLLWQERTRAGAPRAAGGEPGGPEGMCTTGSDAPLSHRSRDSKGSKGSKGGTRISLGSRADKVKHQVQLKMDRLLLLQAYNSASDAQIFLRDRLLTLNSFLSVCLLVTLFQLDFVEAPDPIDDEWYDKYGDAPGRMVSTLWTQIVKGAMSLLTLLSVVQIYDLHWLQYRLANRQLEQQIGRPIKFRDSDEFWAALYSSVVFIGHAPPWTPAKYDYLALIAWVRVFQVFRLMRGFSKVYRNRENIIRACTRAQARHPRARTPRPRASSRSAERSAVAHPTDSPRTRAPRVRSTPCRRSTGGSSSSRSSSSTRSCSSSSAPRW